MNDSERLPALRADLELSAEAQATGTQQVTIKDPLTQRAMNVRGFQLSICRMIDGHRTAGELVSAAQAIGIPLTLEKLEAFLGRLRHLGFLAAEAPREKKRSLTWTGRAAWGAETRAQYQHALKEARLDHLETAKENITALLAKAPNTDEARVLLEWIDEQIASKAAGKPRATFADVFAEVEDEWAAEESERLAVDDSLPEGRGRLRLVAVALLGILALLLFMPIPHSTPAHWHVTPGTSQQVLVTGDGRLELVPVKEGQWVEANALLARYEGGKDAAAALNVARQQLAEAKRSKKTPPQRLAELAETVKRLERERLVNREVPPPVVAPSAGYVRGLTASSGSVVESGQELCRIDAAKKVRVVLEAPVGVTFPDQLTIDVQGRRVDLARDTVVPFRAEGELEGLTVGAEGDLKVDLGWKSFANR